jgi:hypothetical protein
VKAETAGRAVTAVIAATAIVAADVIAIAAPEAKGAVKAAAAADVMAVGAATVIADRALIAATVGPGASPKAANVPAAMRDQLPHSRQRSSPATTRTDWFPGAAGFQSQWNTGRPRSDAGPFPMRLAAREISLIGRLRIKARRRMRSGDAEAEQHFENPRVRGL